MSPQYIVSDCMQMSSTAAAPVIDYTTHITQDAGQMTMRAQSICLADARVFDTQADSTANQAGST